MAQTRQIGLFGVGECGVGGYLGNLSNYPPQWPDGSGDIDVGSYSPYPLQLSLYNALRFFWGPKKWRISFDYEYDADLADDSYTEEEYESGSYIRTKGGKISLSGESGDGNSTANSNYIHGAEDESYLFCRAEEPETSGFRYAWSVPVTYERKLIKIIDEETGETETEEDEFTQNLGFSISTNYDITQAGFPSNFVRSSDQSIENLWVAFVVTINRRSAFRFSSLTEETEESINATFNFLGQNYTLAMGSAEPEDWVKKSEISNVVIEPTEWWSYDGLFDTSTGEKLDQ